MLCLEVQRALVYRQSSFFRRFTQGGVGVANPCDVFAARSEFHSDHAFADQLASHSADDVNA